MTLIDSGIWIDFYNGIDSAHTRYLKNTVPQDRIVVGDLVLTEVLQGYRDERSAAAVHSDLMSFRVVDVGGPDIAIQAARHYRQLRARGITIRSTIDTLIATRCIAEGWSLLHRDRDYEPFITHLGLQPAIRMS